MKYHEKAVKSRELEWKHNGMKDKGNTATKIDYGIVMSYLDASHVPHCHKDDDSPFNYYEKCMSLFYFFFFLIVMLWINFARVFFVCWVA